MLDEVSLDGCNVVLLHETHLLECYTSHPIFQRRAKH